jgi:hypothetical protein
MFEKIRKESYSQPSLFLPVPRAGAQNQQIGTRLLSAVSLISLSHYREQDRGKKLNAYHNTKESHLIINIIVILCPPNHDTTLKAVGKKSKERVSLGGRTTMSAWAVTATTASPPSQPPGVGRALSRWFVLLSCCGPWGGRGMEAAAAAAGPAAASSVRGGRRRLDPAAERCLRDEEWSERTEIGVECLCKGAPSSSSSSTGTGTVLVCSDQCAFCNADRTVCGIKSTEALYDPATGARTGVGMVYEYLKLGPLESLVLAMAAGGGTATTTTTTTPAVTVYEVQVNATTTAGTGPSTSTAISLALQELGCVEDEETEELLSCGSCDVYLGGVPCNSCTVTECGDGGVFAPVMDCSNLQEVSERSLESIRCICSVLDHSVVMILFFGCRIFRLPYCLFMSLANLFYLHHYWFFLYAVSHINHVMVKCKSLMILSKNVWPKTTSVRFIHSPLFLRTGSGVRFL